MGVMYFPDEVPKDSNKANSSCLIKGCLSMLFGMMMLLIYVVYCVFLWEPPKQEQNKTIEQLKKEIEPFDEKNTRCEISKVWLGDDWGLSKNLYGDTVKGFYIHVNLEIENHIGKVFKVLAFLYDNNSGKYIRGKYDKYQADDGIMFVQVNVEAVYEVSKWRNLTLFVPYDELDCQSNANITCVVIVRDMDNRDFERNESLKFRLAP